MTSSVDAILLCGGKGVRLRPLTETLPKPLVPIKGKPILGHILDHLSSSPIEHYYIAAGYEINKIHEYFSSYSLKEKKVTIVDTGEAEIIKRIYSCAKLIKSDGFLVLYGDTLADINIKQLLQFHASHNGLATITLWPMRSPFGVMEVGSQGRVESYLEKPILNKWINIGFFYFSSELISKMESFEKFEDFIEYLVNKQELYAFKHTGKHITVNTLQELNDAEQNIDSLKANHE